MNMPTIIAHGALGNFDELIMLSISAIFLVMMVVSWIRSQSMDLDDEKPPDKETQEDESDTNESDTKKDYFRLDWKQFSSIPLKSETCQFWLNSFVFSGILDINTVYEAESQATELLELLGEYYAGMDLCQVEEMDLIETLNYPEFQAVPPSWITDTRMTVVLVSNSSNKSGTLIEFPAFQSSETALSYILTAMTNHEQGSA